MNQFTPVCQAHLLPEVANMAKVIEAAYRAGEAAGGARVQSDTAMRRRWDEMVAGSSLEGPQQVTLDQAAEDPVLVQVVEPDPQDDDRPEGKPVEFVQPSLLD